MKYFVLACLIFTGSFAHALEVSDIKIKDGKILFQGKDLHPGCFRQLSTAINGDALSMIVNIEFERPKNLFIGRGCMTANKLYRATFTKNGYLTYADDDNVLKKVTKDPLLRFDGYGYKLAKKIDDKTFAVDVRGFTTGSSDFLSTLLVRVVEHPVFLITPEGKSVSAKVIGLQKIGEILNGTVDWQEKLQDALKTWKRLDNEVKKKTETI